MSNSNFVNVNITVDGKTKRVAIDFWQLTKEQQQCSRLFTKVGNKVLVVREVYSAAHRLEELQEVVKSLVKKTPTATIESVQPSLAVWLSDGKVPASTTEIARHEKYLASLIKTATRIYTARVSREAARKVSQIAAAKRDIASAVALLKKLTGSTVTPVIDL